MQGGPDAVSLGASSWSWLIAAGMSMLLAVWLTRSGWRVMAVRYLVIFLLINALFNVANGLALGSPGLAMPWQLLPIATLLVPAAALSFYGAYRAQGDDNRWAQWAWPAALGLLILTLAFPTLWAGRQDGRLVLGPVFVMYGLNYLMYAALAFELTRDAIKEETDADKRRSMLFLALGFSFVPAYVSTSEFFFVDVLGLLGVEGLFFSIAHYISVAAGAVLVAMFILLARAALRTKAEQQKVDVAWFLLAVILPGASVMVQLLFVAFNAFNPQMSVAVEGVWAMLFPLFVALAVARFSSFGMIQDSRPGLRIMLFGFIWPLAFALGWMAGVNSFQDAPTLLVAVIFMLLPLPFVKMLWRQTNLWASKILGSDPDQDVAGGAKGA